MSDAQGGADGFDDEQAIAEELDDDRFDDETIDYPPDYPPDHALASLEATAPTDTGDVPQDSLEERLWREEPDVLPPRDEAVEILEPHPDGGFDPDFAEESRFELAADPVDDGELLGQAFEPSESVAAEEAAIHVVDEPG